MPNEFTRAVRNISYQVTDVTKNPLFTLVGTWACPVPTLNCTETEADVTPDWDTASRCPYEGFGFDRFAYHQQVSRAHLLIKT